MKQIKFLYNFFILICVKHEMFKLFHAARGLPYASKIAADFQKMNWCVYNSQLLISALLIGATTSLSGGEMQDIHIHVTHHNFPARRVIHSWVV
ncbi:hypothetical protein C0J52_07565 [Blattella germanica]|nr:hypothetical protein C0J52_07565 [Blattella germanica]